MFLPTLPRILFYPPHVFSRCHKVLDSLGMIFFRDIVSMPLSMICIHRLHTGFRRHSVGNENGANPKTKRTTSNGNSSNMVVMHSFLLAWEIIVLDS
mmetsp:Transcript_24041/g.36378  ORF Transcript_24041/g.36378 Transcript_24041/m.36378 type:complete len:97 (-) Transcript_24041:25-315(-)